VSARRLRRVGFVALAATALAAVFAGVVWAGFTSKTATGSSTISAAPDFVAPSSSATVVAKSAGGVVGSIKKGGTFYVYANVTDSGNPASGVSSVAAGVGLLTSSKTPALNAGSFEVGGVSYNRRSAQLTALSTLVAGTLSFDLTMTDAAGNSRTESGLEATGDNTAPSAADVQTVNGGSTVGLAQQGDSITFTYSEPIDPNTILSGWSGAATSVVLRLNNATNDTVTIYNSTNATLLPLGTVSLGRSDYTTTNRTFGASGTASTMTMSGNSVKVTLGTQSGAASTAASTGSMSWTPSATATDWAGNATSTTAKTETGSADKEF